MRYLEAQIAQPPARRNPMHQFLVETAGYEVTRLLHRDQYAPGEHAALFHVEGPVEPYRTALADRETVIEFELDPCPDESFYLYVAVELAADDRVFASAFDQPGLLVVTPVEYRSDGAVRVTAVGPSAAIQSAVDEIPAAMGVDVRAVGEFRAGRVDERLELTQRQRAAVEAAVETGYYGVTREATLETVADRLDCAPGTAAELLRRAERSVMANLVDSGPF